MRRMPTRPNDDLTQHYNSVVQTVSALTDTAKPGLRPAPRLTPKVMLRYEECRLGVTRLYQARQTQVEIERVVRVQRRPDISPQDVAITEDGRQYRIDTVQAAMGTRPPSLDLSLVRITQVYEVVR